MNIDGKLNYNFDWIRCYLYYYNWNKIWALYKDKLSNWCFIWRNWCHHLKNFKDLDVLSGIESSGVTRRSWGTFPFWVTFLRDFFWGTFSKSTSKSLSPFLMSEFLLEKSLIRNSRVSTPSSTGDFVGLF